MELNTFVQLFAAQFDNTPDDQFHPELAFRELEEWSSLVALSVIAMVDDEFNVQLDGDDIRNSKTIKDIFTIVKSKMNDV